MKRTSLTSGFAAWLTACVPALCLAQTPADAVLSYVEAARTFADTDHAFIFGRLCETPIKAVNAAPVTDEVPAALPVIDTAREWYAEPARSLMTCSFWARRRFLSGGCALRKGLSWWMPSSIIRWRQKSWMAPETWHRPCRDSLCNHQPCPWRSFRRCRLAAETRRQNRHVRNRLGALRK